MRHLSRYLASSSRIPPACVQRHSILSSPSLSTSLSSAFFSSDPSSASSSMSVVEKSKELLESLKNAMKPQDNLSALLDEKKEVNTSLPPDFEDEDEEWVEMINPETGEWNGPRHGEPTKFGDWQSKGRTTDFE